MLFLKLFIFIVIGSSQLSFVQFTFVNTLPYQVLVKPVDKSLDQTFVIPANTVQKGKLKLIGNQVKDQPITLRVTSGDNIPDFVNGEQEFFKLQPSTTDGKTPRKATLFIGYRGI